MLEILDPLRAFTFWSVLLRLVLAALFGALVGFNPGRRHRPAGFRTYSVVCIGAASVMLLSQYLLITTHIGDPARLGAQVISGIGFLGAGTILITGHSQSQHVKGLTTAAGLWSAACMGLSIGAGFYEGALFILALLLILIAGLSKLDKSQVQSTSIQIYIEYESEHLPFSTVLRNCRQAGWSMTGIEFIATNPARPYMLLLDLHRDNLYAQKNDLLSLIGSIDGVLCVEEL